MAESTNDESIESIVAERLDSIFGDDDEGAPPQPPQKASPFEALKGAAGGLTHEFDQEALGRLSEEVLSLGVTRGKDPLYRPLLKMMGILMDHLGTAKEGDRAKAIDTFLSVVECMESIEGSEDLADAQRRRRVQQEIESFKAFRSAVQKGRVVTPEKARPAGKPPSQGEDQPAPSPEPAPAPVVPEDEGKKVAQEKEARPAGKTPPPAVSPQAPSPAPDPSAASEEMVRGIGEAIQDLRKEMTGGLGKMAARLDTIQSSLDTRPAPQADLSEALARIEQRISLVDKLPEILKELRTALLKAVATTNRTIKEEARAASNSEDLRAGVHEEVNGLRQDIQAWMSTPEEEGGEDRTSGETLARIEERMDRLQEETASLKNEIQALRSGLADLPSIPRPEETRVEEEKSEAPVTEPVPEEKVLEKEFHTMDHEESYEPADEEEASSLQTTDEHPGALAYFFFQAGEKNYAVEARHVVKAVRIGGGLKKKALKRGGLTVSDTTTGPFSSRKGLEPLWDYLSAESLKQTLYHLVPEDSLDGLAQTGGGGALFLSVNDKTHLILSNSAPEKVALGEEDEVQMAGVANDEPGVICGSILRAGGGGELHLVLAPERL